jgi:hypothetical protein
MKMFVLSISKNKYKTKSYVTNIKNRALASRVLASDVFV